MSLNEPGYAYLTVTHKGIRHEVGVSYFTTPVIAPDLHGDDFDIDIYDVQYSIGVSIPLDTIRAKLRHFLYEINLDEPIC